MLSVCLDCYDSQIRFMLSLTAICATLLPICFVVRGCKPTLEAQKQPLRQHIVVCCVPQLLAQRSAPIILVSISQQTSSRVARQFASFQNRCMGNGPSRACRPGLVKAASSLVFSQATVRPEIGPRAWREDGDITRGLACTIGNLRRFAIFPTSSTCIFAELQEQNYCLVPVFQRL